MFLITWKLIVHISDRGRMQHIKPMGKGDPLCPLGFHPQVRWPTRCKRCFRYSILFILNLYKLVHFITSNKICVLRDDIVSKKYILENLYQGPEMAKRHSLHYDSRGMPIGMYTVLRYDWRKQERGLVGYSPLSPIIS